ncbi:Nif3-like dinuclear metal center hexameric protein [Enterococcus sp. LJL98]
MVCGLELIRTFENFCPLWLAEEGDPVGLHIGDLHREIQRVMVTLDVRPEVVAEAIEKKVDLIIAKHPPIFRPIKRLTPDNPQNKMYLDLVKHEIAVYAAHTNMDIMEDGLNDWFCEALGIEVDNYVTQTHAVSWKKLVVYTPVEHGQTMRQALGDAGAGEQGAYHHTSYTMTGIGRFTPTAAANPAIGRADQEEEVMEERIEVIYLETLEAQILQAMRAAHPYEEPAYDILPLTNPPKTYGLGRIGQLEEAISVETLVQKVKQAFSLDSLRLIEPLHASKKVQRIAICGGSGEKFYPDALKQGADVFITGDVYYHTAHDMQAAGLTVIDPGHHIEVLCITKLVEKMESWKQTRGWTVDIIASTTSTNPFQSK